MDLAHQPGKCICCLVAAVPCPCGPWGFLDAGGGGDGGGAGEEGGARRTTSSLALAGKARFSAEAGWMLDSESKLSPKM